MDGETKIWEAARATSAASSFFDPIIIGKDGEEFTDGATGNNNPVEEVYREAREIWPESAIRCFVSIGTGIPAVTDFGDNLKEIGKSIIKISIETENTAEAFKKRVGEYKLQGRYFRFNTTGLEGVGLEEYKKRALIASATKRYLGKVDVLGQINECVRALGKCM
jgi:hypothetical protein